LSLLRISIASPFGLLLLPGGLARRFRGLSLSAAFHVGGKIGDVKSFEKLAERHKAVSFPHYELLGYAEVLFEIGVPKS